MDSIKIIIASHKKYQTAEEEMYVPIQVGAEGKEKIEGYIQDNTGDNISTKNPYYCELTGLYWAWKNLDADYIGLVHYRRYFTNQKRLPKTEEEKFKVVLTEKELREKGFNMICGIDEAGRGPLAGPVVVASVIMPSDSMIEGVNDSKKVSEKKREKLYDQIIEEAISYGVGIIGQDEIDEINILNATKKGLTMSLQELTVKPDLIIVDALNHIDTLGIPYESIIKGDAKCYSIAAASIIAKVTRDRIMREWDKVYPQYGFEKHKGYGTAAHIAAIKECGLCPIHRRSFTTHFI